MLNHHVCMYYIGWERAVGLLLSFPLEWCPFLLLPLLPLSPFLSALFSPKPHATMQEAVEGEKMLYLTSAMATNRQHS